jgi:excisionase family DNA binding protein
LNDPNSTLITLDELAEFLGVTPRWIYDNHKAQGIPAFQIGRALRFRRADIDGWLETRRRA